MHGEEDFLACFFRYSLHIGRLFNLEDHATAYHQAGQLGF